jgi:hypothetical protein
MAAGSSSSSGDFVVIKKAAAGGGGYIPTTEELQVGWWVGGTDHQLRLDSGPHTRASLTHHAVPSASPLPSQPTNPQQSTKLNFSTSLFLLKLPFKPSSTDPGGHLGWCCLLGLCPGRLWGG